MAVGEVGEAGYHIPRGLEVPADSCRPETGELVAAAGGLVVQREPSDAEGLADLVVVVEERVLEHPVRPGS